MTTKKQAHKALKQARKNYDEKGVARARRESELLDKKREESREKKWRDE